MIGDYLAFALQTFAHRQTRSWLTILGILIGITAVVSLISIGQGLQDTINQQFAQIGADMVIIMPGGGASGMAGAMTAAFSTERLTDDDLKVIERTKGVDKAIGMITVASKVRFDNELKFTFVMGYPADKTTLGEMSGAAEVEKGREIKEADKYKVVIGYLIGKGEFFENEVKLGDSLYINDKKFEVVGVVERIGTRMDDTQIYIPLEAAKEIFNDPGYYAVYARSKKGFDPTQVADWIKEKLRKARGLAKGEEDFSVQTMEQLQQMVGNIIGIVQLIVIGIAAISLIVGGVGIMNTMYSSVLERTREIGIMKAIGARNSDITIIFLLESGLLGIVGGMIGIALGVGVGKAVEIIAQQSTFPFTVSFPPWLLAGALGFSFIVGAISGTLPAIKASQLKPIEALRYE